MFPREINFYDTFILSMKRYSIQKGIHSSFSKRSVLAAQINLNPDGLSEMKRNKTGCFTPFTALTAIQSQLSWI